MLHCVGTLEQLFILNKIDLLFLSGMLPEAIIPPSDEHSYAQWLEEQDRAITRTKETQENIHLKAHGKISQYPDPCFYFFFYLDSDEFILFRVYYVLE